MIAYVKRLSAIFSCVCLPSSQPLSLIVLINVSAHGWEPKPTGAVGKPVGSRASISKSASIVEGRRSSRRPQPSKKAQEATRIRAESLKEKKIPVVSVKGKEKEKEDAEATSSSSSTRRRKPAPRGGRKGKASKTVTASPTTEAPVELEDPHETKMTPRLYKEPIREPSIDPDSSFTFKFPVPFLAHPEGTATDTPTPNTLIGYETDSTVLGEFDFEQVRPESGCARDVVPADLASRRSLTIRIPSLRFSGQTQEPSGPSCLAPQPVSAGSEKSDAVSGFLDQEGGEGVLTVTEPPTPTGGADESLESGGLGDASSLGDLALFSSAFEAPVSKKRKLGP